MPKPPLQLGTYGTITRAQQPNGTWLARARYRDHDGTTRQVKASGKTGAEAERRLKSALLDRQNETGHDGITSRSTIAELLAYWLADIEASERAEATKGNYRRTVKNLTADIGNLRVREASTGRIDAYLRGIENYTVARDARVVLRLAFALAARHDAVSSNPVADAFKPSKPKTVPRALTPVEVQDLRARVLIWQERQKFGPKRGHDLAHIVDTLLGTGARIGEVLALRWEDVSDLDTSPVTVTITGTITNKAIRQGWTKTAAGFRTVVLPEFAVKALKEQRARDIPGDLVFPSQAGTPQWPSNIRENWRAVRGKTYAWVTPHSFRRTVATTIERAAGDTVAAKQLGHTSPDVTRNHYIQKAAVAPDSSHILDDLLRKPESVPEGSG